ncbi:hypothetical protein MB46_19290 (plasmid) [Arthrobacter alpinus]|nr:hypothetical protein MB46_19290 [Arthrobacter alpinus]
MGALLSLSMLAGGAVSANASAPNATHSQVQAESATIPLNATDTTDVPNATAEQISQIAVGLRTGNAPRETEITATGERVDYDLGSGFHMGFTYDSAGNPIVAQSAPSSVIAPRVGAGADPFPYVSLDSTEQAAGGTAGAAVLAGLICAALGAETAGIGCLVAGGIGVVIVAIVIAHGVCPNNQNMRIYTITKDVQCRND